jgi:hypothetical protein
MEGVLTRRIGCRYRLAVLVGRVDAVDPLCMLHSPPREQAAQVAGADKANLSHQKYEV